MVLESGLKVGPFPPLDMDLSPDVPGMCEVQFSGRLTTRGFYHAGGGITGGYIFFSKYATPLASAPEGVLGAGNWLARALMVSRVSETASPTPGKHGECSLSTWRHGENGGK